jgi:hypothetical protein
MEDPTPIETIDIVLSIFEPSIFKHKYGETQLLLRQKLNKEKMIAVHERLLDEILFKLVKDEYLRIETNIIPPTYRLTFEGELFLLSGSYTAKLKREQLEKTTLESNASQAKIYANRLLWATCFAGIGACALVLWEIILWIYPHLCDYPYIWLWQK